MTHADIAIAIITVLGSVAVLATVFVCHLLRGSDYEDGEL